MRAGNGLIMINIEDFLMQVEKPGRYIGGEFNLPDMTKPCDVRFCFCFPDVYEVGMSNLGIKILYDIFNKTEGVVCERCFAPWIDFGKILKEKNIPLFSIETRKPLKEFDIVGFSVPYEMSYSSVLYMLDLAGIPFRAKDRKDDDPIIVGGGPASANPEPIIDFFDAFFIGDGEEADSAFIELVRKYKHDKKKILEEAAKIQGVYVPSVCEFNGEVNLTKVKKAVVKDLDKAPYPVKPIVPNIEIVHDRGVVELYRGCYAGCRFCQACFFYRPIRYRSKETVVEIAERLIENTGYDEIGLASLSSGDYENINDVLNAMKEISEKKNVVFQMPSLRLDSFTAKLIGNAKKISLTFAPEAGTQRLRNVINKNITDEDIDKSMRLAFAVGYRTVKLYFMLGLPTETDEDVLGIAEIVKRIRSIYFETVGKKDLSVNVSTSMFIPKPVTPFQWVEQISMEEMYRKQELLKKELFPIKGVHYSWHGAEMSILEGVFARGDRKLSYVIERAYKKGCVLDGWTEIFHPEKWFEALEEEGINISEYTGEHDENKPLPWDFIDFGVTRAYLLKELHKALKGETTEPCKHNCQGCGAKRFGECRQYLSEETDNVHD